MRLREYGSTSSSRETKVLPRLISLDLFSDRRCERVMSIFLSYLLRRHDSRPTNEASTGEGGIEHALLDRGSASTPTDLRPPSATASHYRKLLMFQGWLGSEGVVHLLKLVVPEQL